MICNCQVQLCKHHASHSTLRRKEQPSVRRANPPVGWHSITLQFPQSTTVCAWLYTVVICKHPGHFTSMKKLFGDWMMRLSLCFAFSSLALGFSKSISIVIQITWVRLLSKIL